MGITEDEFKKLSFYQQKVFCNQKRPVIFNKKTTQPFAGGTLTLESLANLRIRTEEKLTQPRITRISQFNVVEGYDNPTGSWFRDKVDISALQANHDNNEAVFQIASNFNGLEAAGNPHDELMIYLSPGFFVQGETAAISAAPGLIYRCYFVPHIINGKMYYGQLEKQINFLQAFNGKSLPFIQINNGYVQNTNKIAAAFQKYSDKALIEVAGNIKIGFQEGIQVPFGLSKLKNECPVNGVTKWQLNNDSNHYISQVFSAALMVPSTSDDKYKNLAYMLLRGSYEGTLKSTFVQGKQKVFLPLIGGGVFHNKLAWIHKALIEAIQESLPYGLDITLVIYNSELYRKDADWKTFESDLAALTQETGGKYLRYKNDGTYKVEENQSTVK
ncbi:MAG: hypothetical protein WA432_04005 [Candidatus Babeliaceae bacterium]